ncbi:Rieske 2Fe-2S domain-containing protein [Herbaspirillum camelliae]|uniref:Rieske 2Fe-2S domain-containing protein n=1 Tax=Herbaspirillum camelliae TaxID=1892903 RepID=UPI000949E489|nr:Rieske 2Fe-2S domain-containing protein [Herbaspirillum camelliae]
MNEQLHSTLSAPDKARWCPVIPSADLPASVNVTLGFLNGEEVALWRADNGAPQAWQNKCPHRGLRFTLGRVINNRLSCAYHGWEYQAGDGRCVSIPAHPQMPAPRNICASTFYVVESDGMVWVSKEDPRTPPPTFASKTYLRTMGIRAPQKVAEEVLEKRSWRPVAPAVFRGTVGDHTAFAYLAKSGDELVLLHVAVDAAADAVSFQSAHAQLKKLRGEIEIAWKKQGELHAT